MRTKGKIVQALGDQTEFTVFGSGHNYSDALTVPNSATTNFLSSCSNGFCSRINPLHQNVVKHSLDEEKFDTEDVQTTDCFSRRGNLETR
jgi:hypothetical protein